MVRTGLGGGIPGAPDDSSTDSSSDDDGGAGDFGAPERPDPPSDDGDDGSSGGSSGGSSSSGSSSTTTPTSGTDRSGESTFDDGGAGDFGAPERPDPPADSRDSSSSDPDPAEEFGDELGGDPSGESDRSRDTSDVEFSDRQTQAADDLNDRFTNTDIGPEDVVIGDDTARLTDDAAESVRASQRGAAGGLVGDPVGRPGVDETTAADSRADETTASDDTGDRSSLDRFVEDRLDPAAQSYTERVAEPAGDVLADATAAAQIEGALFGTDRLDRTFESAGETVAQTANVPGIAAGSIRTVQSFDDAASRSFDPVTVGGVSTGVFVPNPAGQQEVGRDATQAGAAVASDAASSPFETTGSLIGGAAVGVGSARAATGVSRRVRSVSRSSGDLDAGTFFDDTRAQTQFGRRRTRGDSDSPEQVTIEETIEEGDVTDTISSEEFVDQRTRNVDSGGSDLETELQQMADEADELGGRQQTPRQRAEQRVPEVDAFESAAARQREIARLEDRFRMQDMSDLDNRVVPQTGGVDATTAGRFGLTEPFAGGAIGGATTSQVFADQPAGAIESEPVLTETGSPLAPGVQDGATAVQVEETTGVAVPDAVADGIADTTATQEPIADTTATQDSIADTTATQDSLADTTAASRTRTRSAVATGADSTGRLRFDVDEFDGDDDMAGLGGGAFDDEQFENPTQSLQEVDDALAEDLGGFDGP